VLLHALGTSKSMPINVQNWFTFMPEVTGVGFEVIAGTFESFLLKAQQLQKINKITLGEFYQGAFASAQNVLDLSFNIPNNCEFCNFTHQLN
jgi:hypothetical protein